MSRGHCDNCADPLDGPGHDVEIDGVLQTWCGGCTGDLREREAEVNRERELGVYEGSGMGEPREEVFEGEDGWYWRKFGGNGEEDDRSTEPYSTKEHAEEGLARVREQDAERQAEIDQAAATPEDAQGEVPENEGDGAEPPDIAA